MAIGNVFKDTFGKVRNRLEGFLYREDAGAPAAPMPSMSDEGYAPAGEGYAAQQPGAYGYPQAGAYQQPAAYQQPGYPQQTAYQPAPAAYQAPGYPQSAYPQQPQQPADNSAFQRPYQAPAQPQSAGYTRNRRAERAAQQQDSNVVDFSSYQQQTQPETAQQAAAASPAAMNARIINARGMGDCRSAITLLRNGDSVLIVLENISEPAEMRRLVDTLSGACYSLTATITKVSRAGVYLLAPQAVAVYADQTTNQMNMAPSRVPARSGQSAGQGVQRPAYQQPYQAPYQQPAYQQPTVYAAPQNGGFMQRAAAPEEAPAQPFYSRQPAQSAQIPAFSTQQAGSGYTPDESVAMEQ